MEIRNIYGEIIYTDESKTIKETLENAVKKGVNLENANLYNANLASANLASANLASANLYNANLASANLYNANLENAYLENANLASANLYNANLDNANKIPIYCKWSHGVTNGFIHIGCEKRSIEDWKIFLNSDEKIETNRDTQEFKQIKAVISAYIAYLEVLNS